MDLPFFTAKRRMHHKRKDFIPSAGPVTTFELVSAEYAAGTSITLSFSKAINIVALSGEQILVDDGTFTGTVWIATGEVEMIDAQTLSIGLTEFESSFASGVFLNAPSTTGIVAADGSGSWAGADHLPLPFP